MLVDRQTDKQMGWLQYSAPLPRRSKNIYVQKICVSKQVTAGRDIARRWLWMVRNHGLYEFDLSSGLYVVLLFNCETPMEASRVLAVTSCLLKRDSWRLTSVWLWVTLLTMRQRRRWQIAMTLGVARMIAGYCRRIYHCWTMFYYVLELMYTVV